MIGVLLLWRIQINSNQIENHMCWSKLQTITRTLNGMQREKKEKRIHTV